jgi:hypothetical protein
VPMLHGSSSGRPPDAPWPRRVLALSLVAASVLAAVSSACASSGDGTAVMEPSSVAALRTPSPAATTSMSEGRSGLRVVSVVPPPYAKGPWTSWQVIVAYLPLSARVVPSRCRLSVNGRRQKARVAWVTLSPAQPILVFSWADPYPRGTYRFGVSVVTKSGKKAVAEWTYTYR